MVYQLEEFFSSDKYNKIYNIPIIESVMIRTPMIISTNSNKREGTFQKTNQNVILEFNADENSWFGYPAKVGNLFFNCLFSS
ncbi:MAG: hypothetical protein LBB45_07065 [Methanobrevibacter sp.]|nr:hypothetical protein [Candidatus Methanovirga basalitermitum]